MSRLFGHVLDLGGVDEGGVQVDCVVGLISEVVEIFVVGERLGLESVLETLALADYILDIFLFERLLVFGASFELFLEHLTRGEHLLVLQVMYVYTLDWKMDAPALE